MIPSRQLRLGLLDEREVERKVPISQAHTLAGGREQLSREVSDRLQHPVATFVEADEALVHERLERVEVGSCDLLRRFERATAPKDGHAREEALLSLGQEVVTPLDGGSERLLARIGTAPRLEQVEPA